jgi:hypothetical protein
VNRIKNSITVLTTINAASLEECCGTRNKNESFFLFHVHTGKTIINSRNTPTYLLPKLQQENTALLNI